MNRASLAMIGKYRILQLVGSGGLGEVYRAEHPTTGEIVALKKLHEKFQQNPKLLGLFHKETMIHSRVSHRHCVKFIEANLTPPNAHIVTEFIDGSNCFKLLRSVGALPPLVACCLVLDMLQGLEHLHCLDIIHSDISPANVMLENTGRVVLADFGLSCNQEVEDYAGILVGTPGYLAPERLQRAPITTLSDIYCTGIVLFELLSGQNLFYGVPNDVVMRRMKNMDVEWVNTGNKVLDKYLKETLLCALAFSPNKRFPTPRDFMYALYQCIKLYDIRYTKRAILQWLSERKMTSHPVELPMQNIYVR